MITMDDQYRLEDFGFMIEPGNEDPLTPVYGQNTLEIPSRIGLWDFGTEIKEKQFSFPLKIEERFYSNMQIKFNRFKDFWLDPYGKPREVKITFDYEADKYIIVKLAGQIVPDRQNGEGAIMLPLIALDPLKYGRAENHEIHWDSTTVTFDDSYSIDTVFVNDIHVDGPQTIETSVNGYAIRPTVLISGSGENLSFAVNGKVMTIGSFSNSVIEIRGKEYRLFKDSQEVLPNLSFIELLPGVNQIVITGSNLDFNLSIRVRDQYV